MKKKMETISQYNMNIYINYILYIGAIFSLLLYLIGKFKNKFSKKYFSLFLGLFFVYIAGLFVALIRGISLNYPQNFIISDLLRSMVLPLSLAFAGLIARLKNIKKIINFAILFSLVFIIVIFVHKLFNFAILGNLIKPTTVQIFNLSAIGFLGFYLLTNKYHKNIGRFIILMSWITIVLSLTKWNFFPIIIFPLFWIIIETRKINTKKRIILCVVIITILTSTLFSLRDNIIQVSTHERYNTFYSYLDSQVMKKDLSGGRFNIWEDLLQQFSKAPLLGIGFGVRPTYINVEDHNIFIFFLIRFGVLLFFIGTMLSIILMMYILRCKNIKKINRLILFLLSIYFLQTSAVDTVPFGQIMNGLMVGGISGIILNLRNADILIKNKNDKPNKKNTVYTTR